MSALTEKVNQSPLIGCRPIETPHNEQEPHNGTRDELGSPQIDKDKEAASRNSAACGKQEEPTNSRTPQSSSSTPATCSSTGSGSGSGSGSNSAQSNKTTTMGKFKDKRPEPLKLNANLNQEIPLDLSVKSAGNVPSGNIFNLQASHLMTTLETPRIVWQDNEALLIKPRLFSSSHSTGGTGGGLSRIQLSSFVGDSPPITPNTPFLDMICSPPISAAGAAGAGKRPLSGQPHSAGILYDSASFVQALVSAQLQYKQHQHQLQLIEDSLAGKMLLNNSRRLQALKAANRCSKEAGARLPRRSCSTESLSGSQHQHTNSLQIQLGNLASQRYQQHLAGGNQQGNTNAINRFSYACQPIHSTQSNGNSNSNSNSTSDSCTSNGKAEKKALTPTSLASATTNLLNINLNSPTSLNPTTQASSACEAQMSPSFSDLVLAASQHRFQQLQLQKSPGVAATAMEACPFPSLPADSDPLLSAAYCQQQPQNPTFRSAFSNSSSSSISAPDSAPTQAEPSARLHAKQQQHFQSNTPSCGANLLGSLGGSTSLNTPTLISPSQLKGGSICFLPSPTLSPMSSVFELPSPLLMFPPPPASSQPAAGAPPRQPAAGRNPTSTASPSASAATFKVASSEPTLAGSEQPADSAPPSRQQSGRQLAPVASPPASGRVASCGTIPHDQNRAPQSGSTGVSAASLAHLVTPAHDKLGALSNGDARKLVDMEVEQHQQLELCCKAEVGVEPLVVFPKILVSQEQQQQQQQGNYEQAAQWPDHTSKLGPHLYVGLPKEPLADRQQQRSQRDLVNKRALSPLSFRNRVSYYHNQRYESCSAPPDVYQGRARPKLKSLACESPLQPQHQQNQQPPGCGSHQQAYKPYPEPQVAARWQQQQAPLPPRLPVTGAAGQFQSFGRPLAGIRPNSAEPLTSEGQFYCNQSYQAASLAAANQNPHQPDHQQLMVGGYNAFSRSAQHLQTGDAAGECFRQLGGSFGAPPANSLAGQPHQQHLLHSLPPHSQTVQSLSAGELHRAPLCPLAPYGAGRPRGSHSGLDLAQGGYPVAQFGQQQQQRQAASFAPASLTELDHLQHSGVGVGVSAPFGQASQLCALPNQSVQGEPAAQSTWPPEDRIHLQQQQQQQLPLQPRALSADGRDASATGPTRPESAFSASSAELAACHFRSSSSASGGAGCASISGASTPAATKKYRCDQCSKSFTRSDMLTRHKRLHSGDRPFQCSECKQEFSRSDHLSTHVRTHTGEKPYKCKLCSYSACRKDMIARHMKVHNRSSPNTAPSI